MPSPTPEWIEVYLCGLSDDRKAVAPLILAGLPARRAFFGYRQRGGIISSGLSVGEACRNPRLADAMRLRVQPGIPSPQNAFPVTRAGLPGPWRPWPVPPRLGRPPPEKCRPVS
jgi:hypothetical protein